MSTLVKLANEQINKLEQTSEIVTDLPPTASTLLNVILEYDPAAANAQIPFVPERWNLAILRQWVNGKKVYTITISIIESPEQLPSVKNSVGARGPCYQNVLFAAILRSALWLGEMKQC